MSDFDKPRYVRVTLDIPTYEGELPPSTWLWEDMLGTTDPVFVVSERDVPDDPNHVHTTKEDDA
ncbi:MAG: hypothetical protein VW498_01475 [Candidatus Thalassarchaeaceae archaeon]